MREFGGSIKEAGDNGHRLALLLFDIDRFKAINDVYGHYAGDKVLFEIASRVKKVIRKTDIVGRLGGDEFVIIQPCIEKNMDVLMLVDVFSESSKCLLILVGQN